MLLSEVPDQVFSQKMMGDGFGIIPADGKILSPVNGEVTSIFPTGHAVGITANNGSEVLIHFGIDTVNLKGEGFIKHVQTGDKVTAGQLLIEVDINFVKERVPSIITPVIFTNLGEGKVVEIEKGTTVEAGQANIVTIK